MKKKRHIFLVFFSFWLSGCGSYFHVEKDKQIKKEFYNYPGDSIVMNKAIICATTLRGLGGTLNEKSMDKDSVFAYFFNAIKKVDLPVKVEYPSSFPCKAKQRRGIVRFEVLTDEEVLFNIDSTIDTTSLQVLPVIGVYIDEVAAYDAIRVPYITLQIYMVQNRQIVYSSFKLLAGESINTLPANPPLSKITQEQWDELVRLVFEDYLNALEKR
jgi:hypothetical protein